MPLIVDASVALAWFVRTQATGYTDRIRRHARRERLHVPGVWPLEFTNALRQLERRKLLTAQQVDTIIDLVEPLDIVVHGEPPERRRVLAIAREHDLTTYDAAYLDLATALRYPVACRDGALRKALRAAGLKLA
ncbi:MAG: type II toxin-antitoxin system VapC family toxin [Betaproteobacteria bacterium]|nr:type II toxin-antitoxin system VapC family toxin [Betaproteobacteria bacterium]